MAFNGGLHGSSPNNDDDEVQKIPAVANIRAGVHDQAIGQDLQEGLNGEDDEEHIFHLFLQDKK